MAETPADVKRDIEMTRERISSTLQQLEAKTNVMQIVKDNPWPAIGVAFAAGFLLSGSRADVKAASATLVATRGTGSRVGTVLDDVVANLMGGLSLAFQQRVDTLVDELKGAIGGAAGAAGSGTGTTGSSGSTGSTGSRGLSQGASASGTNRFADSDVTSSATRGDSVAAAGTTGAAEARSALGGAASGGTSGSTGMGAIGNATQSGGTLSSAGSQGATPGSDWSPQGAKLEGKNRAD